MPPKIRIASVCFAALAFATTAAAQTPLVATLTHDQETTQGTFLTSSGGPRPQSFGSAVFVLNEAQTTLTFTANVFNIDVTGNQTPNVEPARGSLSTVRRPPCASTMRSLIARPSPLCRPFVE